MLLIHLYCYIYFRRFFFLFMRFVSFVRNIQNDKFRTHLRKNMCIYYVKPYWFKYNKKTSAKLPTKRQYFNTCLFVHTTNEGEKVHIQYKPTAGIQYNNNIIL